MIEDNDFFMAIRIVMLLLIGAILIHSCRADAYAGEIAVSCIYDGGDIIFASHVNSDQKELSRTFPTDDGEVSIKLSQFSEKFFSMDLVFNEKGKKFTKPARCIMERE